MWSGAPRLRDANLAVRWRNGLLLQRESFSEVLRSTNAHGKAPSDTSGHLLHRADPRASIRHHVSWVQKVSAGGHNKKRLRASTYVTQDWARD